MSHETGQNWHSDSDLLSESALSIQSHPKPPGLDFYYYLSGRCSSQIRCQRPKYSFRDYRLKGILSIAYRWNIISNQTRIKIYVFFSVFAAELVKIQIQELKTNQIKAWQEPVGEQHITFGNLCSWCPPSSQTWAAFRLLFSPQTINRAEDKQNGAWIDTSIYNMKITCEERWRGKVIIFPAVSPLVQGEINHQSCFTGCAPLEITIIHHRGYILKAEHAGKQTIDRSTCVQQVLLRKESGLLDLH